MGTCLAVIKVTGVVSLGIYAGVVSANVLNSADIFKFVLTKTTNTSNLNAVTEYVQGKVKSNGILLGVLGAVSTTAFQLAYFGAPLRSQHPYLVYSSLVFPITSLIYYYFSKDSLVKLFNIDSLIKFTKGEKKVAISDLDNSVYKDLGEDSSEQAEDDEIAEEVEYHLNQKTATEAVESLSVSSKLSAGVSLLGFVIASVGIYGDF